MTNNPYFHPFPEELPPKDGKYLIATTNLFIHSDNWNQNNHDNNGNGWDYEREENVAGWREYPIPDREHLFENPCVPTVWCEPADIDNATIMISTKFSAEQGREVIYLTTETAFQLISDMLEILADDLPLRPVEISGTSLISHMQLLAECLSYTHKDIHAEK